MFIDHDSQYHHCSGQQYQSQYWCCKSASSYILLPSSLHFKPTELQIKIVNISIRKPNDHHHWLSVFQCRKYSWIQVGQSSSQTLSKVETVLTVQHVTMSRQITLEVTNSAPHTSHLVLLSIEVKRTETLLCLNYICAYNDHCICSARRLCVIYINGRAGRLLSMEN